MASVEITISGTLFDKLNRTTQQVVLIGEASLTGLSVGGGPVIPPGQPPSGGGNGDHIWGPPGPWPSPPIAGIPGLPGAPGDQPHPEHPIVLPPKPDLPPDLPPVDGENRPIDWKTAWTPDTGWIVIGVPQFPHVTPS